MPNIPQLVYRTAYLMFICLMALIVFVLFLQSHINGFYPAMFSDMIYGKAFKPYVYRTLLPSTVRMITSTIPAKTKSAINKSIENNQFVQNVRYHIFGRKFHKNEIEFTIEYIIALSLMFLSLVGFAWATTYLFCSFYGTHKAMYIVPFFALSGLPLFFKYYSYLYDFPNLFLFTVALGLMIREKWLSFILVFIAACLNKETAILLTLIFAIHFKNRLLLSHAPYLQLFIQQLIIFVFIKSVLYLIFRNNPGTTIEFHLYDHNLLLLNFYTLAVICFWLAIISAGAILIFYKWSDKPDFLRHGLWIAVPLFLLTLFFGFIDEWRDYYELYPIVMLLIFTGLSSLMGIKMLQVGQKR